MNKAKHIILIEVEEANLEVADGAQFLDLADHPEEALRRYRALAEVRLQQLVGVRDCHVRFVVKPADGVDAVRFWLLPMLRGEVEVVSGGSQLYRFMPEQRAASFTIDFAVDEGDVSGFEKVARLNFFCVECGAQWLNLALLQCGLGRGVVGEGYLQVDHQDVEVGGERAELMPVEVVTSSKEWEAALERPIGGKLRLAYKRNA